MTIGRAGAGVAALALLATLLVPYDNPSGEAIDYALALREGGATRINPNHLLIVPLVRGIHRIASVAGGVDPLTLLLWIARFSLVAYALLVFVIATRLLAGSWTPFAVAAGCIASHGMLWFGTDGHPVLLAHLPLVLAALLHVLAWQTRSALLHAAAGIAYGVSILVYVSNVLPAGVAALASVFAAARRRQAQGLVAPATAAFVAGCGAVVAHAWSGSPLPIHRWVVAYGGGTANLSYAGLSALSLFRAAFGFGNSLTGTQGAARLVRRWTEGEASVLPLPGDAVDLALWTATLVAAGVMTVLAVRRLGRLAGLRSAVLAVCLASTLAVAVFNFAWIGSHPHFWVPAIPALWIAWGFVLEGPRRKAAIAAVVAVGVLLPYNVLASLRPLRGDADARLRRAELMRLAPEPCFLVTPGIDWMDSYCRYHGLGDRRVLSLWQLSVDPALAGDLDGYLTALRSAIDGALADGRPVFVHGVLDERFPRGVPWREMGPRGFPLERIQATLAEYTSRPSFAVRGREFRELTRRAARS